MTYMDKAITDIISAAASQGACGMTGKVGGIGSLADLFFSPQGKEFCRKRSFPPLPLMRSLAKAFDLAEYGVYVDAGDVSVRNRGNVALIGETRGELLYEGVDRKYTAVLMHGASAKVTARSYAVVEIVNCGCRIECETDKTAVLL